MSTVEEKFLSKVSRFHRALAFRGQEDANWKLHSSAVRRLKEMGENSPGDAVVRKNSCEVPLPRTH